MPGKPRKKQKQTLASLTNPSRRSRTRTRRPKFLSLGLQISPQSSRTSAAAAAPAQMNRTYHRKTVRRHRQKQQLELFPLHPGAHLANGGDGGGDQGQQLQDENDVALLFDSAAAAATATLTGLLDPAAPAPAVAAAAAASSGVVEEEESAVSSLIRCAMKSSSRERGESEEKWVCYSEVIVEAEKKVEMEEVTSCAADAWRRGRTAQQGTMLSLKLDYQGILDAWSDKGSLFVCGGDETPQTVPDLMRVDNVRPSPSIPPPFRRSSFIIANHFFVSSQARFQHLHRQAHVTPSLSRRCMRSRYDFRIFKGSSRVENSE